MKVKTKKKMTRFQFEKMFPNAETSTGYSWEVQEEPAKIANIGDDAFCSKTWGQLAQKAAKYQNRYQ